MGFSFLGGQNFEATRKIPQASKARMFPVPCRRPWLKGIRGFPGIIRGSPGGGPGPDRFDSNENPPKGGVSASGGFFSCCEIRNCFSAADFS